MSQEGGETVCDKGFCVTSILASNEFEPLWEWYLSLNTCAADEHVPEVELYIRTVKDRSQSTYCMLPFRYLPRIILVHLLRNAVFWLNAFPHKDGTTQKYSPWYIVICKACGCWAYAQTHKEHTNNMNQHTKGCICLGPTRNHQGAHWFMSLSSGEWVVRYWWTEFPVPREAINCVSAIGWCQHMPSTITYANRHGHEINDTINELDEDTSGNDLTYLDSQQEDKSMTSDVDDDSSYDDDSDNDDNNDNTNDLAAEAMNPINRICLLLGALTRQYDEQFSNQDHLTTGIVSILINTSGSGHS
jgi:hypothetical protein